MIQKINENSFCTNNCIWNLEDKFTIDFPDYQISSDKFSKLPKNYQENFQNLFKRIINSNDVKKHLNFGKKNIHFFTTGDDLFYQIEGTDIYEKVDKNNLKDFQKLAKRSKTFLERLDPMKTRDWLVSELKCIQGNSSPLVDFDKIETSRYEELKEAGAQWLWATDDAITFAKKSLILREVFNNQDPEEKFCINFLDYLSNAMGMFFSALMIKDGRDEYFKSKELEDKEGKAEAIGTVTRGALSFAGIGAYSVDKIAPLLEIGVDPTFGIAELLSLEASETLGIIGSSLLGISSTLSAISAGYHIAKSKYLRNKIINYVKNPKLSEKERYIGALKFLKDKIRVTEKDVLKITKKIMKKNPKIAKKDLLKLLSEEISKKERIKKRRFERRAGFLGRVMLENSCDDILHRLQDKSLEKEAVLDAKKLVKNVLFENKKKMILFSIILFASLLGILAAILYNVLPAASIIPDVISMSTAVIWIGIVAYGVNQAIKGYKYRKAIGDTNLGREFYADVPSTADGFDDVGV